MTCTLSQPSYRRWRMAPSRYVLIALIAGAGWSATRAVGTLSADGQPVLSSERSIRPSAVSFHASPVVLPIAGQWTFADLEWNLRSRLVDAHDIDACFDALTESPVQEVVETFPEVSQDLIELAVALKIQAVERGGNEVYRLNHTDLSAQLVLRRVGADRKVISLCAAYPRLEDGRTQLVELTPRAATAPTEARVASLLPLPAEARRSGGRFDDKGRLLLELVSLNASAKEVIAKWKEADWEVRATALGDADNFSYLCARGDEVIYAWSANHGDALRSLMLVRTPRNEEMKPN